MSFFNNFNSKLLSLIAKPKNKSTISRGFSSSLLDTELAIQNAFSSVKDNLLVPDEKLNDVYTLIQEGSTLYNLLLAANKFKLTYANLLVYILRTDKIYAPSVAQLIDIFTNNKIQAVSGKSINDLYLALIEETLFSFDPLAMITSGVTTTDPAKQEDTEDKLNRTINRLPVAKLSLEQLKYILSDTDKIRKANPEFIKSYEKYAQEHGYTLDDDIALDNNRADELDKDDISVLYLTALNYFYEMFAAYFISQGIKVDSFKLINTIQNTVNKTNETEVSLDAPAGTKDSGDEENRSYEESTAPDAAAPQEGVGYDNLTSGKGDTPESLNKLVHTILDSIPNTKAALQNTLDTFHRLADQYYTSQVRTDVSQQSAWRNFVEQNKISNFIGGEEIKKLIPPDSKIFDDFVSYYRIKVNKIDNLEKEARYHTAVLSALIKRADYLQKEAKNEKRKNPRELKEPNYLSSVNREIKSIREGINYFTSLLSNKETLELNTKAIQKRSEINQLRKQIDNTQEGPEKEQLIEKLQSLYQDYANLEKQTINTQQEADESSIQNYIGDKLPGDKSAFANMSIVDLTTSLNKKREELSRLENEYNNRLDSFLKDTSNLDKTNIQIELHKEELKNIEPQIEKLKETASIDVYTVVEKYLVNRQERALQELGTYEGVPQKYIDQFNKIFDDKRKYLANVVVPSVTGGSKAKKTKEDRKNQITNKSIGDRSFSNLQATDLRHYVEAYKYIFFYYKEAADSQTETTSELTPDLLEKHYSGEALTLLEKYMPSTTKKMNLWGNEVEVPAYNTEFVADKIHDLSEKDFDSIVDPIDRLIALVYLNVVVKNVYSKNPELAKSFKEQAGYSYPKQDYSKKNPTKLTDAERILYNDINQLLKGAGDVGAQEKAELRILKNKIDAGETITPEDKARINQLKKILEGQETSRDKQIEYKKKLDNDMFMLYDTDNVREYKGKNYVQGPDNLWYRIIYLNDDKTQYNIAKRPTNLPDETQVVEDVDVGTATNTVPTQAAYTKPGAWMNIVAEDKTNPFLGEVPGIGGEHDGLNTSTENLENIRNNKEIENPGVELEEPKDVTLNQKPHKEFSIKDFGNFLKALRSSNPSTYGKILEISNQYTGDSSVNLPEFLNMLSAQELAGKENPKFMDALEVYNRKNAVNFAHNTFQTAVKDKIIPAIENDPELADAWSKFQSQEPLN